MRAIDTNVLVRFLMDDDAAQAERARKAVLGGDVYVPMTVLLETEWVLRSGYRLTPERIVLSLRDVVGLRGVTIEQSARLESALDGVDGGLEFADALHLASSVSCTAFLSFDQALAKRTAGRSVIPVEEP